MQQLYEFGWCSLVTLRYDQSQQLWSDWLSLMMEAIFLYFIYIYEAGIEIRSTDRQICYGGKEIVIIIALQNYRETPYNYAWKTRRVHFI